MNTVINLCALIFGVFLAIVTPSCVDAPTPDPDPTVPVSSRVTLNGGWPGKGTPAEEETAEAEEGPAEGVPVVEDLPEELAEGVPVVEDLPVEELAEGVPVVEDLPVEELAEGVPVEDLPEELAEGVPVVEEPPIVGLPAEKPIREEPAKIEIIRPVKGPPLQAEINKLPVNQQAAINVFKKGSRVFVQNTGGIGLKIRFPAGLDQDRIGGMFDGETGTITAHPQISDNLAWFFIEWDPPVKNPKSGCGDRDVCMGWSVAVTPQRLKVLGLLK